MKRISICVTALLFILVSSFNSSAQLSNASLLDNVSASGVQQMFFRSKVIKVGNYNYVCGATINGNGDYDILLSKFDARVDTLVWSVSYNGVYNGNDYAADLAVDGSSNVIVVGTTQVGSLDYNAITIKYNSSGVQQWSSTYAGAASGPDGFTTVVMNGTDVYAAGGALVNVSNMTDVLCVKYNSSGTQQWATTWNNSSTNLQDAAANISISGSNIAIVAATQETLGAPKWKVATIRMNASTGSVVDSAISSGGSAVAFTEIKDIALDDSESIYVCGTRTVTGQGKNIYVVKYNASLTQAWSYTKNGSANGDDEGIGLELNGSSVFISGYTTATVEGRNLYAAKLAQSNGAVTWEVSHHLADGDEEATGLQIDSGVNLIIPCNVDRNSTKDIAIVKLSSNTGSNLATNFYNSEYNRDEFARDVAVNTVNNDVYISTQVQVNDTTYESRIIKWRQTKVYSPKPVDGYSSYSGYIPNNMQLRATDSTANRTVRFYNQANAIATYIDDSKISYQLVLANDTANADTTYRVDMALVGGKPNAKVYPYGERKEYINYYLGHMDKPSIRTPLSNVVLKQDVYTNTDVLFTSSPTGFRHWFIARTGATPTSYEMNFNGQTGLSVDGSGNLVIATTIGNITYKKAKAYSMNTTTGVLTLLGWQPTYSIAGSAVKFGSIGTWSGVLVLEVDEKEPVAMGVVPDSNVNLDWSTFFGNNGLEYGIGIANNELGEVWQCGYTSAPILINFPGSNIDVPFTAYDTYVVHFNPYCEAQWITYYGGSNYDQAQGIDIDEEGNSFCVGTTNSADLPNNFPDGINDATIGGSEDGFFIMLNIEGYIGVGSYIGGAGYDGAYGIAYRPAGGGEEAAIFIVGRSNNPSGFPIQNSSVGSGYDQVHAGGWDGYLMQLNSQGNLVWSTFLGSSEDDAIYSVASVAGLPTVVGVTWSDEYSDDTCTMPSDGKFPTCTSSGSWQQPEFLGGKNFIARFGIQKNLVHSTFFGPRIYGGYTGFYESDEEAFYNKPTISSRKKTYDWEGIYDFYVSGQSDIDESSNFPFTQWPLSYSNPHYSTYFSTQKLTFRWLSKFTVAGTVTQLKGATTLDWEGPHHELSQVIVADDHNGVLVAGYSKMPTLQTLQSTCLNPSDGEFPLCNANGYAYTETNNTSNYLRSFILRFDDQMALTWSTQFGSVPNSVIKCVSSKGDYVFIGGHSLFNGYTLWEYDDAPGTLDYYRTTVHGMHTDAVIARFHLPQEMITLETEMEVMNDSSNYLSIYPNPTHNTLNVQFDKGSILSGRIEVYDTQGRLVKSQLVKMHQNNTIIDVSDLAQGVYTLSYISPEKTLIQSFVKQ